jgi:serine phosphatase RsbU (regulator of sigma subunit)
VATTPNNHTRSLLVRELLGGDDALGAAMDRLAELAARAVGAPDGFVWLVGEGAPAGDGDPRRDLSRASRSQAFCQRVIDTDRALVITDTLSEAATNGAGSRAIEVAAFAGVPVRHGGWTLGSLCAIDTQPREWTAAETDVLEHAAQLCEHVVAQRLRTVTAVRSERERQAEASAVASLSNRLQQALLTQPTDTGPFDVAITYQPGLRRMLLGGDFAAARLIGDDTLDFLIGDVAGHGPEAAALAVGLRASWRALRGSGMDHPGVVAGFEALVNDAGLTATVLLGTMSLTGPLRVTAAGHPPPIVLAEGGARELAVPPAPMLGLGLAGRRWTAHEIEPEGQVLLAYTDGLTEGRAGGGTRRFGVEGLLAAADDGANPEELIAAATRANGGPLGDDVAILRIAI